jgi:hypothetical protein
MTWLLWSRFGLLLALGALAVVAVWAAATDRD